MLQYTTIEELFPEKPLQDEELFSIDPRYKEFLNKEINIKDGAAKRYYIDEVIYYKGNGDTLAVVTDFRGPEHKLFFYCEKREVDCRKALHELVKSLNEGIAPSEIKGAFECITNRGIYDKISDVFKVREQKIIA